MNQFPTLQAVVSQPVLLQALRAVLAALGEEIDLLGLKNVTVRLETPPPETLLPDFGQMEEPALDQLIDNLLALLAPGEA